MEGLLLGETAGQQSSHSGLLNPSVCGRTLAAGVDPSQWTRGRGLSLGLARVTHPSLIVDLGKLFWALCHVWFVREAGP